jgi:hypothetical protein
MGEVIETTVEVDRSNAGRFHLWLVDHLMSAAAIRRDLLDRTVCGDRWLSAACDQLADHAGTCAGFTKYGERKSWYGKNYDHETGRYDWHLGRRDQDITFEVVETETLRRVTMVERELGEKHDTPSRP